MVYDSIFDVRGREFKVKYVHVEETYSGIITNHNRIPRFSVFMAGTLAELKEKMIKELNKWV